MKNHNMVQVKNHKQHKLYEQTQGPPHQTHNIIKKKNTPSSIIPSMHSLTSKNTPQNHQPNPKKQTPPSTPSQASSIRRRILRRRRAST